MSFLNIVFFIFISFLLLYSSYFISVKFDFCDYPKKNKIHKIKTPNTAGVALIPILIILSIFFKFEPKYIFFFYILSFTILVGFIDDVYNISVMQKLTLLTTLGLFFIFKIGYISYLGFFFYDEVYIGIYGKLFTLGCILLLTNATNYIDGLDGLLGSLTLISLTYFLYIINISDIFILSIIIFIIIYLIFNFGILPKQFIGDSGSLAIGYILAFISIYYSQIEKLIKPELVMWPLGFFVFEFISINIIRAIKKKNILNRDLNFIFNIFSLKYNNYKSLIFCVLIHIFLCMNGLIIKKFQMYEISSIAFMTYFIIYLFLRIKQNKISI